MTAQKVRNVSLADAEVLSPWQMLAHAIIVEACKDYRRYHRGADRRAIENFFRSQYFGVLSGVNPEELIQRLNAEEVTIQEA